ncbi:methyltransferase domain-containing protein [Synechococcus elongatus]|uniref:methyltransferase domain-containing protein n=1 Tax=Synechococcus elongatus TaxID=32046 RepID=UPI0030CB1039
MTNMVNQAQFWEQRYQEGSDRWDLGQAAPVWRSLLAGAEAPSPGRIAVLGCGRGHDARLFAEKGFAVVGFDFAPSAIAAAQALAQGTSAEFLERDIFALPQEFADQFDYVLEHTCFCAIDPDRRSEYVEVTRQLLKPGGALLGLFWCHDRPSGPPYGCSLTELRARFAQGWQEEQLKLVTESVEGRRGEEYLGRWRRLA